MEKYDIKIVHFVEELGLGCTAKTAVNFCKGLFDLGFNVEVWSLTSGKRADELSQYKIKLTLLSKEQLLYIDKSNIDIFHFHSSGLPNLWMTKFLSSFTLKTKIIQTNIFGGYCNKSQHLIDLKLFVSEATLLKYKLFGGSTDKNFGVLYNPVQEDAKILKTNKLDKNKFILGRISRPDVLKWDFDFEIFLKFLKKTNIDFTLKIVGVPNEVKQNLSDLNIDIEFIDKIENQFELDEFYSSLDVLVHLSSIGESFGCVFVEAMNYGVPVIVKSTPISRFKFWRDNAQIEVVDNGITGYVCNNILSMRDALLILISNPLSREQIIKRNKLKFDKSEIINKLCGFYFNLLENETINLEISNLKKNHSIHKNNIFKTPIVSYYHLFRYKIDLIKINFLIIKRRVNKISLKNYE